MCVNRDLHTRASVTLGYFGIFWDILGYMSIMFFQKDLIESEGRRDADPGINTRPVENVSACAPAPRARPAHPAGHDRTQRAAPSDSPSCIY